MVSSERVGVGAGNGIGSKLTEEAGSEQTGTNGAVGGKVVDTGT